MINKIILVSGSASVGKTAVIKALMPYIQASSYCPCVCKMDCIMTDDDRIYRSLGIPCIVALSKDICPDHYLVSNLEELMQWGADKDANLLFIETAGLCHRCSPATEKTIHICVIDCTASCKSPEKLGPMLTEADIIVLTKIDLISQAEKEIISYRIHMLNSNAKIYYLDGLNGYGAGLLAQSLLQYPDVNFDHDDRLRHTMPSGVCSYCVGEMRIGCAYQQGIVEKIDIEGGKLINGF